MKFRKKPVEIEAMCIEASADNRNEDGSERFLDPNAESIAKVSGWMMGNGFRGFKVHGDRPFGIAIETLEGVMVASPGDWIIRGVQGEFYPCKSDIFEATYERVADCPRDLERAESVARTLLASPALRDLLARERAAALRDAAEAWPREVNAETIRREIATPNLRDIPEPYRVDQWLRDRAEREAPR